MSGMHGSIFGCIYPFQFKFGNLSKFGQTGNSAVLVCPFSVIENTITKVLCSEVKTIFALKLIIVTV
jgi:hypothetical protein